ncbi:MAG: hypothetical protein HC842_00105 [Cytophagales bacterium]|nr:hypothetical protein [Cytophagales bacterium]
MSSLLILISIVLGGTALLSFLFWFFFMKDAPSYEEMTAKYEKQIS